MFEKILIANRGEIACRVAATAKRMGIRTVAVYSDADAQANHVLACDEAVHIGGAEPSQSYLRVEAIVQAAKQSGAQAIHPGYGFLSENEAFASACAQAGLVFIGPGAQAIAAMGLKSQAKQRMEAACVPLVPGYHGADQRPDWLQAQADRIGYPVLIKASAGGGGKGMRVVEKPGDFLAALASCQREAGKSFGDDAVLIESYVQRPRHIEIQVFADTHGQCVYLFERDCSVQRRHQKLIEEAPAPGLSTAMREQMGQAAVAAARAVNYVGAGTVEFIVAQTGDYGAAAQMQFYFMEMNTRLQVEHPVTEAITGLDLVEWQLRVAAGEPLPLRQDQIRCTGHAIEARICAENPEQQFLPATGRLSVYRKPAHASFTPATVRFDDGVREGSEISPYYDSLVAKLIVHGRDRAQALRLLDEALAQTHLVGVASNVQFLRNVLQSPSFAQAHLDTALIERERPRLFEQHPITPVWAAAFLVAHTLIQERRAQDWDPFSQRDGWHSHGRTQREFVFRIAKDQYSATLSYGRDGNYRLSMGERSGSLSFECKASVLDLVFDTEALSAHVYADGERLHIFSPRGAESLSVRDSLAHAGERAPDLGRMSAPMPGKVLSFRVQPGDRVSQGQVLAVIEAMKMEHSITSPGDGVVLDLLFAPGDQVGEGLELLRLQLDEGGSPANEASA